MSTRITTTLIDDLDGSEAVKTVPFAFDGISYAIDLNEENLAEFAAGMQKFIAAARRQRGGNMARKPKDESEPSSKAVRAWAAENGIEVNSRGRLSDTVVSQYLASN